MLEEKEYSNGHDIVYQRWYVYLGQILGHVSLSEAHTKWEDIDAMTKSGWKLSIVITHAVAMKKLSECLATLVATNRHWNRPEATRQTQGCITTDLPRWQLLNRALPIHHRR